MPPDPSPPSAPLVPEEPLLHPVFQLQLALRPSTPPLPVWPFCPALPVWPWAPTMLTSGVVFAVGVPGVAADGRAQFLVEPLVLGGQFRFQPVQVLDDLGQ